MYDGRRGKLGEAFQDGASSVVRSRGALVYGDCPIIGDEVEVGESAAGIDAEDGHGSSLQVASEDLRYV
jgi:hypothetical protein